MNTLLFMDGPKPGELLLIFIIVGGYWLFYKLGFNAGYKKRVREQDELKH